jgi:hypothetical protein
MKGTFMKIVKHRITNAEVLADRNRTSYEAASAEQRREAVAEDIAEINRLQKAIVVDNATVMKTAIRIVNAMWRQGQALQRVVGRSQLTFTFFKQFEETLPFDFETAKKRIALTCRMESEITQWEQLALDTQKLVMGELQMLAVRAGAEAPLAHGECVGPTGVFTLLLNDFVKMKQTYLKATRAMPLDQQSPDRLQSFLDDTLWLAEERDRAAALLAKTLNSSRSATER